ncbi:hypothetical protein [Effusibacillus dendaii]|uniref:Uncharacterized protein n=1 Tax=Effusibacillus dendaii TaxID=2743772 RepID=A0A7I8DE53_9BACL|nr:hypothetical protein [Effusibacillus dendaii]BCJ87562.1 hypothetical protein skT53_25470 [Effusibacillus dendaii]
MKWNSYLQLWEQSLLLDRAAHSLQDQVKAQLAPIQDDLAKIKQARQANKPLLDQIKPIREQKKALWSQIKQLEQDKNPCDKKRLQIENRRTKRTFLTCSIS